MVVLLAIAGAVAAVLFNRASTETDRLEAQTTQVEVYGITNKILCGNAGGVWQNVTTLPANSGAPKVHRDALFANGITTDADVAANEGYCQATPA